MSPGVLFSTGYIAGASIAGVLIAIISFGDTVPKFLARWEYREVAVGSAATLDQQIRGLAADELGEKGRKPPARLSLLRIRLPGLTQWPKKFATLIAEPWRNEFR